ncbi:unnamed protein product [Closterium sp. NIES-53]
MVASVQRGAREDERRREGVAAVEEAAPRVAEVSYSRRSRAPGPGEWSAQADEQARNGARQLRFSERVRRSARCETETQKEGVGTLAGNLQGIDEAVQTLEGVLEEERDGGGGRQLRYAEEELAGILEEGEEGVEVPQQPSEVEMATDPNVSFLGAQEICDAAGAGMGVVGEEDLASNVRQRTEEDAGYLKVHLLRVKRKAVEKARRVDVDDQTASKEAQKKVEEDVEKKMEEEMQESAVAEARMIADAETPKIVEAEVVKKAACRGAEDRGGGDEEEGYCRGKEDRECRGAEEGGGRGAEEGGGRGIEEGGGRGTEEGGGRGTKEGGGRGAEEGGGRGAEARRGRGAKEGECRGANKGSGKCA